MSKQQASKATIKAEGARVQEIIPQIAQLLLEEGINVHVTYEATAANVQRKRSAKADDPTFSVNDRVRARQTHNKYPIVKGQTGTAAGSTSSGSGYAVFFVPDHPVEGQDKDGLWVPQSYLRLVAGVRKVS